MGVFIEICNNFSHYHYGCHRCSISLACELLATVLRILSRTFARHSCECRTSVVRIFMCHELVAKALKMFNLQIYNAKFSRHSYECREVSLDGRATVLRKHTKTSRLSGEKIKVSDIRTDVARLSYELK